jgi:hypothetical protein
MTDASPDWSHTFDDPIPLPDGRTLRTLHDAGHYATALPKAVQERVEWQTAAEMLIPAAQGQRPVMFAEIAMRQALHASKAALARERRRKPAKSTRSFARVPLAGNPIHRPCAAEEERRPFEPPPLFVMQRKRGGLGTLL